MRLSEWLASAEFEASGETKARAAEAPGQRGAAPQCLAWNPSHVEPMALALGFEPPSELEVAAAAIDRKPVARRPMSAPSKLGLHIGSLLSGTRPIGA